MARKPAKPAHGHAHAAKAKKKKHMLGTAKYRAYIAYVDKHFPEHQGKKAKKPVKAVAPAAGGTWILAGNDEHDTCAIAALANSLRYKTGTVADDEELLSFGESLPLVDAIRMVMMFGLAGRQLARASLVPHTAPGMIASMIISEGAHAALYLGNGKWASWGGTVTLNGAVTEDSWQLDWR